MYRSLIFPLLLLGAACAQSVGSFPTITAPPEHQPMVIETSSLQEQVDPLESRIYVLGNIPGKVKASDLVRTESLSIAEQRFLAHDSDADALTILAAQHGMSAGPKAWVVFSRGALIAQYDCGAR